MSKARCLDGENMCNLIWAGETGLNKVLLPIMVNVVNNIVQHCLPAIRCKDAEQYCCQH